MWGRILAVAALIAGGLALQPSSAAVRKSASPPTLCLRAEETLFSCPLGRKTVSVCGHDGGATYRFGKPPHVEIEGHGLKFAEKAFSGGGESQIVFESNGYTYIVYDRTIRTAFGADGTHDPKFTTGLIVQKTGRTISNAFCVGTGGSGISPKASKALPAGTYVPH